MHGGDNNQSYFERMNLLLLQKANERSLIPIEQMPKYPWDMDMILSVYFSGSLSQEQRSTFVDAFNEWFDSGWRGGFPGGSFLLIYRQRFSENRFQAIVGMQRTDQIVALRFLVQRLHLLRENGIVASKIVLGEDDTDLW